MTGGDEAVGVRTAGNVCALVFKGGLDMKTVLRQPALITLAVVLAACTDVTRTVRPPESAGASARLDLSGPRVVRAKDDPYFIEKQRFRYNGSRIATDACRFAWGKDLQPGDHFTERVTAYDLDTCEFIVARGQDTRPRSDTPRAMKTTYKGSDSLRAVVERRAKAGTGTAAALRLSRTGSTTASAASFSSVYQRLYHEDPPGWEVNSSRLTVDWDHDGLCVYISASGHSMSWLYQTGWFLASDYHAFPSGYCSSHTHYATARYQNNSFCVGLTTYVDYLDNRITVNHLGAAYAYNSGYASGACSSLLSYRIESNAVGW